MQADAGLETLLDLNGYTLDQEGGYWVKVEAWRVPVTADIPHGIRYRSRCTSRAESEFWATTTATP